MKKFLISLMIMAASYAVAMAESTVYLFFDEIVNTETSISINGNKVCDLTGTVTKVKETKGIAYPLEYHGACFRKISVTIDGKALLKANCDYFNPVNGDHKDIVLEYPIDFSDGATYYLKICRKGLTGMQIKDAKEKDAQKWMQKWEKLADVSYPATASTLH